MTFQKQQPSRDFPGSTVVKTLPSNAGGVGLIPGWETKVPHASWPNKTEKRSNIVTNSISLLKWSASRKENPEQTQPMQNSGPLGRTSLWRQQGAGLRRCWSSFPGHPWLPEAKVHCGLLGHPYPSLKAFTGIKTYESRRKEVGQTV